MKSGPGASYECPLVLEASPQKRQSASVANGNTPVICIDSDSEEDRKPAAKPSKRPRTPLLLNPSGPTTLTSCPWASLSLNANDDSDNDNDADAAFARQLQEQEWASRLSKQDGSPMSIDSPPQDATLAAALNNSDDDLNQLAMQSDASLAARLQQEEHQHKNQRVEAEQRAMSKSLDGRAWLFVNQVLDLHKRLSTTAPGPQTVAVDDMVYLGKNFLQCIQDFEQNARPARVTLAYHYTRGNRMDSIKQDGLMTLADRKKAYNKSRGVGVFGDGVYTATNPFAFRHFGDVGLLVAVVLGHTSRVVYNSKAMQDIAGINTKIGNKALYQINGQIITEAIKYTDELVLRESKQCLPLMRFDTASVSSQAGQEAVWMYHQQLQSLLDSTFNKNVPTSLTRVYESSTDPYRTGGSAAARAATLAAHLSAQVAASRGRSAAAASNAATAAALAFPGMSVPSSTHFSAAATGGPPTAFMFPAPGVPGGVQSGSTMPRSARISRGISVPSSTHFSAAATGGPPTAFMFPAPGVPGGVQSGSTMPRSARRSRRIASKSAGSGHPLSGSNLAAPAMIGGPATAAPFATSSAWTPAPSVLTAQHASSVSRRSRRSTHTAHSSSSSRRSEVVQYTAPTILSAPSSANVFENCSKESKDDCVICMESLANGGRVVSLKECGHEYHKQCIKGALKSSNKCPVCRTLISKPRGHCPSGTMRISSSRSIRCGGFDDCGSILISYEIPSGTQLSFHENPGQPYHGTTRTAYLPDNEEGRKLLKRLVFAWEHGLTFTVGTSLTTRQPNCITWTSIHHKTSPTGGQHGFPDQGYFLNANGELDAAGVPK